MQTVLPRDHFYVVLVWLAAFLSVGNAVGLVYAVEGVHTPAVQTLDGRWGIALDHKDAGKKEQWFRPEVFSQKTSGMIRIPGCIRQVDPDYNGVVWCGRTFAPGLVASGDQRSYLRFGAVTYSCDVWLNGVLLGSHEGAQSPFEFDATKALLTGRPNFLAVRLCGQSSKDIAGINQHVALAAQPLVRIKDVFAKPDFKTGRIELEVALENNSERPATVELKAVYGQHKPRKPLGEVKVKTDAPCGASVKTLSVRIDRPHLWDLDDPFLYSIAVTSDWTPGKRSSKNNLGVSGNGSPSPPAPLPEGEGSDGWTAVRRDSYSFRTGFRDFRVVDGYFRLNGKRIILKSSHSNWYDPVVVRGTPGDMTYLKRDFPEMKRAGFNMFRLILSSALPEQLDQADELGLLIFSEHDTSWLQTVDTKFGISLNEVVRRDRNHPSLVIWCLLNETPAGKFYDAAKAWLPSLRAVDDTRLVLLSSGRWDEDLKTGSGSNPGSKTWDVYFGGEDANHPIKCAMIPTEIGGYRRGVGDAHIYQAYPTSWEFIEAFAELGRQGRPIFVSEAGLGSSCNVLREQRKMEQAGAPKNALAWKWIAQGVKGLQEAWPKYHLETLYPSIEQMLIDSELNAARQRELMFSIIRSNPHINGYNLTSWLDCWGAAEGVVDPFREFKPGHLPVLQAGWAKLRWCLLMNTMHVYADGRLHLKIALASEDALPAGEYPATLCIGGGKGVVWEKKVRIAVPAGPDPPLVLGVFEGDVSIAGLGEGVYTLSAKFDHRENAAGDKLSFYVADRSALPIDLGPVTALGLSEPVRKFLTGHGAVLREYDPERATDREVVVVGEKLPGKTPAAQAAAWRALYGRVARGACAVFLSPDVFQSGQDLTKWLALRKKGNRADDNDWLYHKDVIAMPHPMLSGLQTKIMTPDYYGSLLCKTKFFHKITPPDETAAVAIRASNYPFEFKDGVMLGTYRHHAGRFTIHGFNLIPALGQPAGDRLLLNMIAYARTTAGALQPLPADYDGELDSMGIKQ
jgi:hypothetical protein